MSDLISREDAIELLTKIVFDEPPYLDLETLCRMYAEEQINVLPSAETEWIPCSERLPEDGVAVLITTENEEVYIDQVITDPYKERYFQSNTAYDNFQVIAWRPLPKPYREDGEA